jgi:YD repeat-containing protein
MNIGKKKTATDPKGNIFRYTYDAIGRLLSEKLENSDPNVGVERDLNYNDQTNVVKLTFGNGTIQQEGRITFDDLFGKPIKIQRKLNGAWTIIKQYTYDTNGRLYTESDGLGHTITHTYDPLDREVLTQLPNGATTTQTWDDRKLTITDANNNTKDMTYDLLDRLTQVDEHPNSDTTYTTGYAYDSDAHLVKTVNHQLAETKYGYDNIGRLIRTDYPQDTNQLAPETFTYDNVGNLLTKTGGQWDQEHRL